MHVGHACSLYEYPTISVVSSYQAPADDADDEGRPLLLAEPLPDRSAGISDAGIVAADAKTDAVVDADVVDDDVWFDAASLSTGQTKSAEL